jgi:hypothetical protein
LYTIRKAAKIGLSRGAQTAIIINGVNLTILGALILATPVKNSKASRGLPTLSTNSTRSITSGIKSRRRGAGSDSEEADLTDESDFEEVQEDANTFFKTPNKSSDKMRPRVVPPIKYAVEVKELGGVGSEESDYDPNVKR